MGLPYDKRTFRSFISAAHADLHVVGQIESWLSNMAGVSMLFKTGALPSEDIERALGLCQSMIIVLTRPAMESGWVRTQVEAGIRQQAQAGEAFSIILIRIEQCEIPDSLQGSRWVDMSGNGFDVTAASELIQYLYPADPILEGWHGHDIFVTPCWREGDAALFGLVCGAARQLGFRLVCNSAGPTFEMNQARRVIGGCGGMVAVLSSAFGKQMKRQILEEVELALSLNMPYVLAVDESLRIPRGIKNNALAVLPVSGNDYQNEENLKEKIHTLLARLQEKWIRPPRPPYIFYGTDLKAEHKQRNQGLRRFIEKVSLMPCQVGDEIQQGQIQQEIIRLVANAHMMIADVSNENLNTCIEAGVAIGAGVPVHLVSSDTRHKPPFMFRDRQVWHYESDMDLLGIVHKLILPYRRNIL